MFADFQPLPLLGNPHVQTLLGSWLKAPRLPVEPLEHLIALPDGDRLVVHDTIPTRWQLGEPITLMVHGLGGCHRSPYLLRMASLLLRRGFRVIRMDLRGSGRGISLARRSYHGGSSDDVRAVAAEIHRWSPTSPLTLIGISLGGNIVLKLAGEAATDPVPNLQQVVAIAPPIDLGLCSQLLSQRHNRLYEKHFLRLLLDQLQRRQRYFHDLQPVRLPRRLTMRLFDELYTAPRWDFLDADDYYRRASSIHLIEQIPVPALILAANDDPFIAVEPFKSLKAPEHIEVHILKRGGHLGFLGWDGTGGIRWADRRVTDWVLRTSPPG